MLQICYIMLQIYISKIHVYAARNFNIIQAITDTKKKCLKDEKKEEMLEKIENNAESENNITPELIIEIIKQNQEFKNLLLEQNKTIIELSKNNSTKINN